MSVHGTTYDTVLCTSTGPLMVRYLLLVRDDLRHGTIYGTVSFAGPGPATARYLPQVPLTGTPILVGQAICQSASQSIYLLTQIQSAY